MHSRKNLNNNSSQQYTYENIFTVQNSIESKIILTATWKINRKHLLLFKIPHYIRGNVNIVTHKGLAWLIIMGSRFRDWIYWHFFTITVNYDSSHIELLLNDVCLTNLYEESLPVVWISDWSPVSRILDRVESYVTTDGQSASLSWNKAPIRGLRPDFYYCQTVAGLLMWGALSDERTGLSFTIAAGPRQRSHSQVRVP
jgi:hypothetical protein